MGRSCQLLVLVVNLVCDRLLLGHSATARPSSHSERRRLRKRARETNRWDDTSASFDSDENEQQQSNRRILTDEDGVSSIGLDAASVVDSTQRNNNKNRNIFVRGAAESSSSTTDLQHTDNDVETASNPIIEEKRADELRNSHNNSFVRDDGLVSRTSEVNQVPGFPPETHVIDQTSRLRDDAGDNEATVGASDAFNDFLELNDVLDDLSTNVGPSSSKTNKNNVHLKTLKKSASKHKTKTNFSDVVTSPTATPSPTHADQQRKSTKADKIKPSSSITSMPIKAKGVSLAPATAPISQLHRSQKGSAPKRIGKPIPTATSSGSRVKSKGDTMIGVESRSTSIPAVAGMGEKAEFENESGKIGIVGPSEPGHASSVHSSNPSGIPIQVSQPLSKTVSTVPSASPTSAFSSPSQLPRMSTGSPSVMPALLTNSTTPTSESPSLNPSSTTFPSVLPSFVPTVSQTSTPSAPPTFMPTAATTSKSPTGPPLMMRVPFKNPQTVYPASRVPSTNSPTALPTEIPSMNPSAFPGNLTVPSVVPAGSPSSSPSAQPSSIPTASVLPNNPALPTVGPTMGLTFTPSTLPSFIPSAATPSNSPTGLPSIMPAPLKNPPSESPMTERLPRKPTYLSLNPRRPIVAPAVPSTSIPSTVPSILPTAAITSNSPIVLLSAVPAALTHPPAASPTTESLSLNHSALPSNPRLPDNGDELSDVQAFLAGILKKKGIAVGASGT